jgi:hypothetical protein
MGPPERHAASCWPRQRRCRLGRATVPPAGLRVRGTPITGVRRLVRGPGSPVPRLPGGAAGLGDQTGNLRAGRASISAPACCRSATGLTWLQPPPERLSTPHPRGTAICGDLAAGCYSDNHRQRLDANGLTDRMGAGAGASRLAGQQRRARARQRPQSLLPSCLPRNSAAAACPPAPPSFPPYTSMDDLPASRNT